MNDINPKFSIFDSLKIDVGKKFNNDGDVNLIKNKIGKHTNLQQVNINMNGADSELVIKLFNTFNDRIIKLENYAKNNNVIINANDFVSLKHYEDVRKFIIDGSVSDLDIVDFIADHLKDIKNGSQEERTSILDAEYFILNASDFEKTMLVWGWLVETFWRNLAQNGKDWFNQFFVKDLLVKVRAHFKLNSRFCDPSQLPTFVKVGANVTINVKNVSLSDNFLKQINVELTNSEIITQVPEFNFKRPEKMNWLIGIDNIATHICRSLAIAAEYFISKICGIKIK